MGTACGPRGRGARWRRSRSWSCSSVPSSCPTPPWSPAWGRGEGRRVRRAALPPGRHFGDKADIRPYLTAGCRPHRAEPSPGGWRADARRGQAVAEALARSTTARVKAAKRSGCGGGHRAGRRQSRRAQLRGRGPQPGHAVAVVRLTGRAAAPEECRHGEVHDVERRVPAQAREVGHQRRPSARRSARPSSESRCQADRLTIRLKNRSTSSAGSSAGGLQHVGAPRPAAAAGSPARAWGARRHP